MAVVSETQNLQLEILARTCACQLGISFVAVLIATAVSQAEIGVLCPSAIAPGLVQCTTED
jgi:hypothetical protein